ncbi:MAG: damage-inducible protein DinB [Ignavibacteria bacterium]|nr:damage-inducible protein DinB [Ignavibacteria bacterium]
MKDHFVNLFQYENWANKEIADSLMGVNDLPEKILSIMSHIINAQTVWLSRIKNESCEVTVWQVYEKSGIQEALNKSSSGLSEFINTISENDLGKIISYSNTKGEKFNTALEDILTHLTHHSAYHRGQIVLMFKTLIPVLPNTDYIFFMRNIVNRES